jgi:hypothetical protein
MQDETDGAEELTVVITDRIDTFTPEEKAEFRKKMDAAQGVAKQRKEWQANTAKEADLDVMESLDVHVPERLSPILDGLVDQTTQLLRALQLLRRQVALDEDVHFGTEDSVTT